MTDKTPPERADEPGMRGTYGQRDFSESAQRSRSRKDQHSAARPADASEVPDPYGEGAFPTSTESGERQSGYGVDYGQLEGAQRHETAPSESDIRKARNAS